MMALLLSAAINVLPSQWAFVTYSAGSGMVIWLAATGKQSEGDSLLVRYGDWTYGLYLTHPTILCAIFLPLARRGSPDSLALVAFTGAASILIGCGFGCWNCESRRGCAIALLVLGRKFVRNRYGRRRNRFDLGRDVPPIKHAWKTDPLDRRIGGLPRFRNRAAEGRDAEHPPAVGKDAIVGHLRAGVKDLHVGQIGRLRQTRDRLSLRIKGPDNLGWRARRTRSAGDPTSVPARRADRRRRLRARRANPLEAHQQGLRFGIAEAAIEFEDAQSLIGIHQSGIQQSAKWGAAASWHAPWGQGSPVRHEPAIPRYERPGNRRRCHRYSALCRHPDAAL